MTPCRRDSACIEIVESAGTAGGTDYVPCAEPGSAHELNRTRDGAFLASIGRRVVRGGPYCEAHGGIERARRMARADWGFLAPASVGDDEAVLGAGTMSLASEHAIVLVRREADGRWRAYRGIGSHMDQIPPAGAGEARAKIIARCRPGTSRRNALRRARKAAPLTFASREEAVARAVDVWREERQRELTRICLARGGRLDWGLPIVPRDDPLIVEARDGETSWDAYARAKEEQS